ncbi:MAG TPA: DNA polymerase III subunit delta' [Dehalococcoidia bacterium]|nr:DNA polymerase III subunit delta' [Dehalococcoidia bacterium]
MPIALTAMPWNITGNARAVNAVARSLASEHPPHAYLFTGPDRVGKATLALRLTQTLNCAAPVAQDPSPEPCLACTPCTRIARGLHADAQTVRIETNPDGDLRMSIAVDQLRDVERSVALSPYEGRTRVVIIDPADAMTTEAQNAFLKTLEEPPPHVVLILIATREELLLPTVHSRCRRIEFRLAASPEIEAALIADGVENERAGLLARLARGRIGWALEMARDPGTFKRREEILDAAHVVAALPIHKRIALAEKMLTDFRDDREAVYRRLSEWAGWWRDVMLIQCGAEAGVANADRLADLREDAAHHTREEVTAFLRAIFAAIEQLRAAVQPRPALELLLLEAPAPPSPG